MRWFTLLTCQIIFVTAGYVRDDPTSVINGDLANIEDYPFYAFLKYKDFDSLLCGGTVIQTNIVLTAAHCLGVRNFTVHVGITSADDLNEAEAYEVDDFLIHPLYDQDGNDSAHDIGLVRLTKDVVYGSKVNAIDLSEDKPSVDDQVTVVGFGRYACDQFLLWLTSQCLNPQSDHLRMAVMNITSIENAVIESVGDNQNVCYGDSGGPMIYDNKIVGVASSVDFEDCSGGNTYAPVDEHIPWIQEYIEASRTRNNITPDATELY